MVAKDFIDLFLSLNYGNRIAVEDYSDRLTLFTVLIFLLACIIVSAKQYFMNSISCYIPVKPSGENYNSYLADYCWVHGTIPLRPGEPMPETAEEWEEYDKYRKIIYYQWVPFLLAFQCIFFYIPRICWQSICSKRSGGDLFSLIKSAADAATLDRAARTKMVNRIVEFLEDMIDGQRECRHGRRAELTRRAHDICGVCVVSKRLGTCLVFSYLCVKVVTIINAILQVYLIQRFLGFHPDGSAGRKSMQLGRTYSEHSSLIGREVENLEGFNFGWSVLSHIMSGRDWPETLLFPRVSFCRVPGLRLVGVENTYTAQCTLPINMLNEKIYIFLWFWIVFLIFASTWSLLLWIIRLIISPRRKDFIKRYLRIKHISPRPDCEVRREDLDDFTDNYLRRDGVFIVRMFSINAGEVITSEVVSTLYQQYLTNTTATKESETISEKEPLKNGSGNPPTYV